MKEQTIEKISEDEFIRIIDDIHHLVHRRIVRNAKIMSTTKPKQRIAPLSAGDGLPVLMMADQSTAITSARTDVAADE